MDRGFDVVVNALAASKRAELIANYEGDPAWSPDRADRSDLGVLKDNDYVQVFGFPALVVCPAESAGYFYTYSIPTTVLELGQYHVSQIEDRAPADPEETPMPIFPESTP